MRSSRRGPLEQLAPCGCRCSRSTSSTTAALSRAGSNPAASPPVDEVRHHAGGQKSAKIRSVEGLAAGAGQGAPRTAGRSVGITLEPRTVHRTRRRHCPMFGTSPRDNTRRLRARESSGCTTRPLAKGEQILVRPRHSGSSRHRGRDREGGRSRRVYRASRTHRSRGNHVGEIGHLRWRSRLPPIPIPTIPAPDGW